METIENIKLKKTNWKIAKVSLIDKIQKKFKIETIGLDDESEYFHIKILIDDLIHISAQGDTKHKYVYGYSLKLNEDFACNGFINTICISINEDEKLFYVLNNLEKIKSNLLETLSEIKKLTELAYSIDLIKNNMIWNCVEEIIDKSKIKKSIDILYEISEFLENKRLNK